MGINNILAGFTGKKILVIGDVMLDHYIWGKVERISPEAPVPVLDMCSEEYRLGGAANVAMNLKALGAEVFLCGLTGCDAAGDHITAQLHELGIDDKYIFRDCGRPTTKKTRIGAATQQIVRIDMESRSDISRQMETDIIKLLEHQIKVCDAIIIEDYNKGLLTENLINTVIALAKKHGKLVTVDPKQRNFFSYLGVDVFKPNFSEMQKNIGLILATEDEFFTQAKQLKDRLQCKFLVVTRGELGLYVFADDDLVHHIPTFAIDIFDVSGAGDTVISVLTLALSQGCDIVTAATIANHAAGIVCGKIGTATVSSSEILESYHTHR